MDLIGYASRDWPGWKLAGSYSKAHSIALIPTTNSTTEINSGAKIFTCAALLSPGFAAPEGN
jgi:hypothetical protein